METIIKQIQVKSNNGKILTMTIERNKPSAKGIKQLAQAIIEITKEIQASE